MILVVLFLLYFYSRFLLTLYGFALYLSCQSWSRFCYHPCLSYNFPLQYFNFFCIILCFQLSPDVKVVGSKNFVQNVGEMTKKSNALYNSKLDLNVSSRSSPVVQPPVPSDGTLPSYARLSHSYVPKSQALSSGGKVPLHGPRRFVNPGPLFRGDYETDKCKFYKVNKSEVDNYKILCVLASSEFQK